MLVDLAKEYTTTVGVGPLTVTGAVPGYLTLESAGVVSGPVSYGIVDGLQHESARGTYDATTNVLTRCVSHATTTNNNNPIELSGNAQVGITAIADDFEDKLDDSQLDTDATLAANSDTRIASQKAVKTYADTKQHTLSAQNSGSTNDLSSGSGAYVNLTPNYTILANFLTVVACCG